MKLDWEMKGHGMVESGHERGESHQEGMEFTEVGHPGPWCPVPQAGPLKRTRCVSSVFCWLYVLLCGLFVLRKAYLLLPGAVKVLSKTR